MALQATSEQIQQVLHDPRWAALTTRDSRADGSFFYSVETTGIYCRPSCGARVPRPEHVHFHESAQAAEAAGFRACKRCKPNQLGPASEVMAQLTVPCRQIESADEAPSQVLLRRPRA